MCSTNDTAFGQNAGRSRNYRKSKPWLLRRLLRQRDTRTSRAFVSLLPSSVRGYCQEWPTDRTRGIECGPQTRATINVKKTQWLKEYLTECDLFHSPWWSTRTSSLVSLKP